MPEVIQINELEDLSVGRNGEGDVEAVKDDTISTGEQRAEEDVEKTVEVMDANSSAEGESLRERDDTTAGTGTVTKETTACGGGGDVLPESCVRVISSKSIAQVENPLTKASETRNEKGGARAVEEEATGGASDTATSRFSGTKKTVTRVRKSESLITSVQWTKLNNLKELYELGFLTLTEYRDRKAQLVDYLTGTTLTGTTLSCTNYAIPETTIINRPPPDFSPISSENAIKHKFDLKSMTWKQEYCKVKVDTSPFARGGLREAYHIQDLCDQSKRYVGKMAMDPNSDQLQYFRDVEMQMYCKQFADCYNEYGPPKKVDFISAWLLTLVDRPNQPLSAVEQYIEGPYRKHNNNYGYVNEDERNTPQAFSHFTYEASNHTSLVCDIQGVGDLYTDPQMHSIEDVEFGRGNLGIKGVNKFLQTHRCNAICRYLRLPSINAKQVDAGTIPSTKYMSSKQVEVVNLQLPPSCVKSCNDWVGKELRTDPKIGVMACCNIL
eukprot:Nk52_evm50s62 gene=Nk52_evmTU50s62